MRLSLSPMLRGLFDKVEDYNRLLVIKQKADRLLAIKKKAEKIFRAYGIDSVFVEFVNYRNPDELPSLTLIGGYLLDGRRARDFICASATVKAKFGPVQHIEELGDDGARGRVVLLYPRNAFRNSPPTNLQKLQERALEIQSRLGVYKEEQEEKI